MLLQWDGWKQRYEIKFTVRGLFLSTRTQIYLVLILKSSPLKWGGTTSPTRFQYFGCVPSWLLFPTKLWEKFCTIPSPCPPSPGAAVSRGLIPQPVSSCSQGGTATPACCSPPDRVNGKLIPDSHLSHADLINSHSFGFIGWRVPGFRSALPESKPGQLYLLILEMHSKEKQHPCEATQERWLNLPASSSAALPVTSAF